MVAARGWTPQSSCGKQKKKKKIHHRSEYWYWPACRHACFGDRLQNKVILYKEYWVAPVNTDVFGYKSLLGLATRSNLYCHWSDIFIPIWSVSPFGLHLCMSVCSPFRTLGYCWLFWSRELGAFLSPFRWHLAGYNFFSWDSLGIVNIVACQRAGSPCFFHLGRLGVLVRGSHFLYFWLWTLWDLYVFCRCLITFFRLLITSDALGHLSGTPASRPLRVYYWLF